MAKLCRQDGTEFLRSYILVGSVVVEYLGEQRQNERERQQIEQQRDEYNNFLLHCLNLNLTRTSFSVC